MHIKLGVIETLSVSEWKVIPDDRQEMIEVVGGVIVQDFGHISDGDKISCKITIRAKDAPVLLSYWHQRQLMTVTDEGGAVWANRRLLIKSYSYKTPFPEAYEAEIELWGR